MIDSLLKRFPACIDVDQIHSQKLATQGLTSFENRQLDVAVQGSLRVWPDNFNTNGFFAVKLTKLAPLGLSSEKPLSRPFETTRLSPVSPARQAQICEFLEKDYGFSLPKTLETFHLSILEREDQLFLVPVLWLENFASLPFYSLGMPLARTSAQGFELSVDFILRFGDEFTKSILMLEPAQEKAWLAGLEIRNLDYAKALEGRIIAIRSHIGLNMGAGKANPNRLRNLLPHRNLHLW